jgi:hypothetical protein
MLVSVRLSGKLGAFLCFKVAQNARMRTHQPQALTRPLGSVNFVRPLVRNRAGCIAILVVFDGFSNFVALFPVRSLLKWWLKYYGGDTPSFGILQCIVRQCYGVQNQYDE